MAQSGGQLPIEVILTCSEAVAMREIRLRLVNTVTAVLQIDHRERQRYGDAVLRQPQTLSVGTHRFQTDLFVSDEAPPTYLGFRLSSCYELHVQLDIPLRRDISARFPVTVESVGYEAGGPAVFATNVAGPANDEPYLEVAPSSRHICPGDTLIIDAAVFHTPAFNTERSRFH